MYDYKPNPRIVARAAELWVRMLRSPKYDNGDSSLGGGFATMLARMIPSNATDERLEAFRVALTKTLSDVSGRRFIDSLHTDYGPEKALADAASAAGLEMEFPWKTSMWLGETYLSLRAGYGAESVYHYPLPDDRWLVTRLSGPDIGMVIDYVQGGKPEFTVECDVQPVSA